jgi:hypothetical protein
VHLKGYKQPLAVRVLRAAKTPTPASRSKRATRASQK